VCLLLISTKSCSPSDTIQNRVENLPQDTITLNVKHPFTGKESSVSISLFAKPGVKKGSRYACGKSRHIPFSYLITSFILQIKACHF